MLIKKSSIAFSENWCDDMLVRAMDDGEMGSLHLFPDAKIIENRKLGRRVSDFQYTDQNGVEVVVSLNVDDKGRLFELDIWKTDFNKLIELPHL